MLDFRAQSQFAQATAAMMCSCAMAATTTLTQSATHSLSLWCQMLRTADTGTAGWPWPPRQMALPAWMPFAPTWTGPSFSAWTPLAADWTAAWARPALPGWGDTRRTSAPHLRLVSPAKATVAEAKAPDPGYASYRSAGGHATAQVIIATPQAALEELASTMVLSPMQTMLDLWRSALRV